MSKSSRATVSPVLGPPQAQAPEEEELCATVRTAAGDLSEVDSHLLVTLPGLDPRSLGRSAALLAGAAAVALRDDLGSTNAEPTAARGPATLHVLGAAIRASENSERALPPLALRPLLPLVASDLVPRLAVSGQAAWLVELGTVSRATVRRVIPLFLERSLRVSIGRAAPCDVILADAGVASEHAEVRLDVERSQYLLSSLSDGAETFGAHSGQPLAALPPHCALRDRMLLRFGPSSAVFCFRCL